MSRDCCAALPHGAVGLSAVVFVLLPNHTYLLFLKIRRNNLIGFNINLLCMTISHIEWQKRSKRVSTKENYQTNTEPGPNM